MKFLLSLFLIITNVNAGTISIIGPCSEEPLLTKDLSHIDKKSVGKITVEILEKHAVPFIGSEQGINSIFETPTGIDAMEVLSDNEMLAYGWCYSINGFEPASYPSEVFASEGDSILWWFGYAHYKDGQWITQCTPSHQRRSQQFCDK